MSLYPVDHLQNNYQKIREVLVSMKFHCPSCFFQSVTKFFYEWRANGWQNSELAEFFSTSLAVGYGVAVVQKQFMTILLIFFSSPSRWSWLPLWKKFHNGLQKPSWFFLSTTKKWLRINLEYDQNHTRLGMDFSNFRRRQKIQRQK